jgi:hypothetical protein
VKGNRPHLELGSPGEEAERLDNNLPSYLYNYQCKSDKVNKDGQTVSRISLGIVIIFKYAGDLVNVDWWTMG